MKTVELSEREVNVLLGALDKAMGFKVSMAGVADTDEYKRLSIKINSKGKRK